MSIVETVANTLTGFVISYSVWRFVCVPFWNLPIDRAQNFWITCIFTVTSLARSYVWRRIFNHERMEKIQRFLSKRIEK